MTNQTAKTLIVSYNAFYMAKAKDDPTAALIWAKIFLEHCPPDFMEKTVAAFSAYFQPERPDQ